MDLITAAAMSVHNPLLTAVGLFLDNDIAFAALIIILLLIGEPRNAKRAKVMLSFLLVFLSATVIKDLMNVERPCAGQPFCPDDYSFPSIHAAIVFTLTIAFLDKRSYGLYLAFALFTAFTRLNIGVHTFRDICGGLALAVVIYYVTDIIWQSAKRAYGARGGAARG